MHDFNLIARRPSTFLALGAAVACAALATGCVRSRAETRIEQGFQRADADGDGALSLAEFRATRFGQRSENPDARFAQLDRNADGRLTQEEIRTAVEARRAESGRRGR